MAILPQETPVAATTTKTATTTSSRRAPRNRKAPVRNHSGNLSDGTASTAASLSSSSSEGSANASAACKAASTKKTNRRRRGAKKGKGSCSSKGNSSSNNHPPMLSAAEQARYIALDCEMVGVGPYGRRSALARVSMVDWNGDVVLDEYVQPDEAVTDYRTHVSGITAQHLEDVTFTLATIRPVVAALLQDKILVGHGLKADMHVLGLHHPWYDVRDTAKYEPFMQVRFADGVLWPRKLRDLCVARQIMTADFQQAAHCSVADAVAALRLYQMVRVKWEKVMEYKKAKTLQIIRKKSQQQEEQHPQEDSSSDDHSDESSQASY